MKKKLIPIVLLAALLLALCVTGAHALTSLDNYAKARLSEPMTVYAGPGTNYKRLGTCGNGGVDRIYGVVENGWLLLGYGYSDAYRIGYCAPEAVGLLYDINGTINYNLTFPGAYDSVTVMDIKLTDDPVIAVGRMAWVKQGTPVKLLAIHNSKWAYVECTVDGSLYRGFMRTYAVESLVTPAPVTPTRTVPPVTPTRTVSPYVTPTPYIPPTGMDSKLSSVKHNCTSTGKLLPGAFSPYVTDYFLSVGNTVNYVRLTPTAYQPAATITVNGQRIASGTQSQKIYMSDQPQAVTVTVSYGFEVTTYTFFLQRRPDDRRTRVSAGFINNIYESNGKWYIDADLVSVNYFGANYANGNLSSYTNSTVGEHYKHVISPNCTLYYGTITYPVRAINLSQFMTNYRSHGSNLYRIVYIQDEIVAIMPYAPDTVGSYQLTK